MSATTFALVTLTGMALMWLFARASGGGRRGAHEALARGAKLIDVRTPAEFHGGHVRGARNIPLQSLGDRLDEVGARDTEVVLCCASGNRSRQATNLLRSAGFTAVHDGGGWASLQSAVPATASSSTAGGPSRAQRRAEKSRNKARRRRPRKA